MTIGKMIGKMKSIIAKIKNKFFCDHVYETIRYSDSIDSPIMYFVCIKCGKIVFGKKR